MIRISDTGTGMSAETCARAVEPFFTTKDVGHGTGLGLSQVHGFAKQSGGHIRIDSVLGEGTSVTLFLPVAPAAAAQDSEPPANAFRPGGGSGEMVLVVEDDPDVRAHSTEILRELGYATCEAADAYEALAILRREPAVAVLFSDIGLPGGMNGRQLADEALLLRPQLKILLATGYARSAIADGERLPSGVDIIAKPFEFAALGAKLAAMLPVARRRILIVEDDPLLRLSLQEDLEALGFEVQEAASGAEALESPDGICAAIVDIGLPDMKGDALTAVLRGRNAALPVIVASGYGEAQIMERLGPDPFIRFLAKPYTAAQVEAVLCEVGVTVLRPATGTA